MIPKSLAYTVIIPTRDRSGMLAFALASVAEQTLLPEEVIVVDNSLIPSTIDGSRLTKLGVRVLILLAPQAANAAEVRNLGLKYTHSDMIAFLDDDDSWLPQKMEKQARYFMENPECCAVVCGRIVVSDGSRYLEMPKEKELIDLLPYDNFGGSFSFIVFRRMLCGNVSLDEKLVAFQDWDFLLRVARMGSIGVVPEVLAVYNDHRSPRITHKIAGRCGALCRVEGNHRSYLQRDARRWIISRIYDLRAQEFISRSEWGSASICVWLSLKWGRRCRIPSRIKYRSFLRRIALLMPPSLAYRLGAFATKIKIWDSSLQLRKLSV
jgi:glycosyltransferase involved in cell wall biosynthesis